MTLADLRKELKEMRKKAMPVPVSRMKKGDVAAELDRLRGKESAAVTAVMVKEEVPKAVAKKVSAVQKVAHKEQEAVVKKTAGVKRAASPPPAKKAKVESKPKEDKPSKGSEEMKARMAKLREMRKAKKEEA
jgi:hypothetical protein